MGLLDKLTGSKKVEGDPVFKEIDEVIDSARSDTSPIDNVDTAQEIFEINPEETVEMTSPLEPRDFQEREEFRNKYTVPKSEVPDEIIPEGGIREEKSTFEIGYDREAADLEEKSFLDTLKDVVSRKESIKEMREKSAKEFEGEPDIPTGITETPEVKLPESEIKPELTPEKKQDALKAKPESTKWSTFKQNVFGTPSEELDYARRAGYLGKDKSILLSENEELKEENRNHQIQLSKIEQELDELRAKRTYLTNKHNRTETEEIELSKIKRQITVKDADHKSLMDRINENKSTINNNKRDIILYDQNVIKGKKLKPEPSGFRKQLKEDLGYLGKGAERIGKGAAETLPSGIGGLRTTKPWFGAGGFLETPKISTRGGIVEPVRGGSTRLAGYTRETGKSVKGGIGEALTTVRASKVISPMGVPGTVAGAKQQFSYNIPARVIPLASLNRASINPDILPNIYETKRVPVVKTEYKEVIQPDGTVINVPVTTQQRKAKIMTISVNRFNAKNIKVTTPKPEHGVKFTVPSKNATKRDTMISRGIGSVGNIKPITGLNVEGIHDMGSSRSLKVIDVDRARPSIDLGLINARQSGLTLEKPGGSDSVFNVEKTHERKRKKISALVDLTASKRITKNINDVVSKQKKKH